MVSSPVKVWCCFLSVKKLSSSQHVVTAADDEDDGTFSRLLVLASSIILINARTKISREILKIPPLFSFAYC